MPKSIQWFYGLLGASLIFTLACTESDANSQDKDKKEEKVITTKSGLKYVDLKEGTGDEAKAGKVVEVHYTGWLKDGTKFDSSKDRKESFKFPLGAGRVIKGWDEGVEGMKVGDTKQVTVKPEEGYGPVIQEAIVEVEQEQLPEGARKVEAQVQAQGPDGQILRGQVTELKDDKAIIDFNHPLAGKTLVFDVKVLDIQ